MTEKSSKVGPQGTQVFEVSEVESLLVKTLNQENPVAGGQPMLICISKPLMGKKFELTGDTYEVGRTSSSGIHLDEPSVSSSHAQLKFRDGQWQVVNLLSSNGTFVNGDRVSSSDIFPGDRIRFGAVELMYVEINPNGASSGKSGMTLFQKILLVSLLAVGVLAAAGYWLM